MNANQTPLLRGQHSIRLFLCGDVMTGRGIDQILPHPGNPVLYESYIRDARDYVRLAERANGPIPLPVSFSYIWGEALTELERAQVDVRIINLETSITTSETYWPDKPVLYRMHPDNIDCLKVAGIDCCVLANNHVMDWGEQGLLDTLRTLDQAGLKRTGAGRDAIEAAAPAVLPVTAKGRVLVFGLGSITSGIPRDWRATHVLPGVNLLTDLSEERASQVARQMHEIRQPDDVLVASIHWGGNWGYAIPEEEIHFSHRLIEEGVDIVHGHSSHHVKSIEVYRDRLILYGCGDFLTDYEGISGHRAYRGDLALMYLVDVDPESGRLLEVRLVPLQSRRFRLSSISSADREWLANLLNELGAPFGTQIERRADNSMRLRWR